MIGNAGLHKRSCHMNSQPKSGKTTSALQPSTNIFRQCNFFLRYPQYHFSGINDDKFVIFLVDSLRNILKMRIVFDMINATMPLENSELISKRKVYGSQTNLLFVYWIDDNTSLFYR